MRVVSRILLVLAAIGVFALCAAFEWTPDAKIRAATGIVLAVLLLWISEVAPLGITAMIIPVAASLTGILPWSTALSSWGDSIVFLFLGAFLLARALDKHGAFDWLLTLRLSASGASAGGLTLVILLVAGAISTMQNNTAVAAMLLPAVATLARRTRLPAAPLLALSYGATFGGMATPVGTAPNFIGYAAMRGIDPQFNFVSWLAVGVPVWLGTTAIGWLTLLTMSKLVPRRLPAPASTLVATDSRETPVAEIPHQNPARGDRAGRIIAIIAFASVAAVWLAAGTIKSVTPDSHALYRWIDRNIPDALPPVVAAWLLFLIPLPATAASPARRTVLDRHDFQSLDWDTLFLIAGGLCLGKTLEASGAATALAQLVGQADWQPVFLMLALGGVTVLLSELTSNTATATLMVPIAKALALGLGVPPVQAIWLVALCASLGFALPVSTPPNAIVYGTRMIPLRLMAGVGMVVDILCLLWVVFCLRWLGG